MCVNRCHIAGIVIGMERYTGSLAEFLVARRASLGLSQAEAADRAGVSRSEMNALERGRVKLPGADKRRRLAAALGGFHAELLVGAGEITPEEIVEGANAYDPQRAGAVSPFPQGSTTARIVELVARMTDEEAQLVLDQAELVLRLSRKAQDPRSVRIRSGQAVS